MNAEELRKQQLDKNALAEGLTSLADRAKSGRLVNPKILGAVAAAVLVAGLWWYFSARSKKAASRRWADFASAVSADQYKKVAADNAGSPVDLPSQLAEARVRFAGDGLSRFNRPAERVKAIEAVGKAREEFVRLAGEFQKAGDATMRAQCLWLAGRAELALVGVRKPGVSTDDAKNPANQMGTVEKAVGFYADAAKAVGEGTSAGKQLKAMADDLTAAAARPEAGDARSPVALGQAVDVNITREAPEPAFEPKAPTQPLDPIEPPTPPGVPSTRSTRR